MEGGRVCYIGFQATWTQRGISLIQYICNEDYAKHILREQNTFTHQDGLVGTHQIFAREFY